MNLFLIPHVLKLRVVHHSDMDKVSHYTYKYRFGRGQFFNLFIGVGLVGFSIFLVLRFTVDITLIVVVAFLAAIGLTPILLTLNYLTKSIDIQIDIDREKGLFEVTQNGRKQICNLKDVTSVEIREQKDIGLYGFDFDFAKYTFVNGKQCIVTNMMTDSYYIPVGLQSKTEKSIFPMIWTGTDV